MTPRDIIEVAAKRIMKPGDWCQGVVALSKSGKEASPLKAKRWDAAGAIYWAAGVGLAHDQYLNFTICAQALAAAQLASTEKHKMSLERVNDELGHAATIDVLRRAWQLAPNVDDAFFRQRRAA